MSDTNTIPRTVLTPEMRARRIQGLIESMAENAAEAERLGVGTSPALHGLTRELYDLIPGEHDRLLEVQGGPDKGGWIAWTKDCVSADGVRVDLFTHDPPVLKGGDDDVIDDEAAA